MDSKNPVFKPFHSVLKPLSEGIGATKNQARVVTPNEESMLWEKGTIGTHSPNALLNAFFLLRNVLLLTRWGGA